MKEIVESYFQQRSLVNHQLASYNDCIPSTDGKLSRMEKIVRNIRIGTDDPVEDDDGGIIKLDVLDKEVVIRMKIFILVVLQFAKQMGRNTQVLLWNAGFEN